MHKWLLAGVFALGFLLRVVGISSFPAGFNADEAGQGYAAYSILKTGRDEWGEFLPLAPRSYGDFRAPLYTYLTVPSVAVFGLNEFAVRLPNAILGSFAVLVVYFLSLELFGKKRIALIASFLFAFSPWHIMLSRGAFEPNLPTLLIPLGILAFLKGIKSSKWMLLSAFIFGISLFSYYAASFLVPLMVIFLFWQYRGKAKRQYLPVAIFLFFLTAFFVNSFFGSATRGADVAIFNPTGGWGAVADARFEARQLGLWDPVARVFNNKAIYTFEVFVRNYLSYLSPQFLFTNGAGESTYGLTPGIGLLYFVEFAFLFGFLAILVKNKDKRLFWLALWILIAPIPAALSKGPGFAANRAAVIMPAIQIASAVGAYYAYKAVKLKKVFAGVAVVLIFVNFALFVEDYVYHAPSKNARAMSFGWRQAVGFLKEREDNYKRIIVSRKFSEPQMFIAFYKKLDPLVVQSESTDWLRYEDEGLKFVDQLGEYRLGKYVIRNINFAEDSKLTETLLVGAPDDFPDDVVYFAKFNYPDGEPAIVMAKSR